MINEKGEKKLTATKSLLWLKRSVPLIPAFLRSHDLSWICNNQYRGLKFTSIALRRSLDSTKDGNATKELSVSFTEAYGATLKPFHGILVRPVFTVCSINFFYNVFCLFVLFYIIHKFLFFSSWQ